MIKLKFDWKHCNRIIVFLLVLAPIAYMFGVLIATLCGAHGTFDLVNDGSYLFAHFFETDNFVTAIGNNALSNSPIGFVPFASMIQFVDTNMLHFSTGSVGVGVMAYGYIYWCAHVLLLDLVFYVSVFFIRIIKRVLNRLEGGAQ